MSAFKRWQFWAAMLISAVFLYFALRGLPLDEFWVALTNANYWWLIPGVAVYFIGLWARAWRWHYLLRPVKAISTNAMFPIVAIGYFGNNIYPARAGEVLRAVILKRKEDVPISMSLATIIVERIFDGVVMLAFVFLNLPELAGLTGDSGFMGSIQTVALIGSIAFIGALLVFLLAAMFPTRSEAIAAVLIKRFVPEFFTPPNPIALFKRAIDALTSPFRHRSDRANSLGERSSQEPTKKPVELRKKTLDLSGRFIGGLEALRSPRDVLMVFVTSVVIWLLETGKYWFVMHAFTFEVSFFALMLMNGIVNLTTTIPSAPGYWGTFDAPGIAVLTAYHVPHALASAYTLVLHVALWLPVTLLGGYYAFREEIRWGNISKMRAEVDTARQADTINVE